MWLPALQRTVLSVVSLHSENGGSTRVWYPLSRLHGVMNHTSTGIRQLSEMLNDTVRRSLQVLFWLIRNYYIFIFIRYATRFDSKNPAIIRPMSTLIHFRVP